MKRIASLILIFITIFVFLMLIYIIKKQRDDGVNVDNLAQIELLGLNKKTFKIFSAKKSVIILYFKTDCHFCINEITAISENIEKFHKVEILFVSSEPHEKIVNFAAIFDTNKINFFQDNTEKLKEILQVKKYPSIFVFSKEKELIKQFKGAVPINNIISEIPNE